MKYVPPAVHKNNNRWKIVLIPIVLIIVLLAIGWIYLFDTSSGDDFLKNYYPEFNLDELVEEPDFTNNLTQAYLTSPGSVMDMEFSFGQLYLLDATNHRIMVFNRNLGNIKNLGEMYGRDGQLIVGGQLGEDSMFHYPGALATDNEGNMVIVDRLNQKLKVWDSDNNYVKSIVIPKAVIDTLEIDDCPGVDASELNFEILSNGNYALHALIDENIFIFDTDFNLVKELSIDGHIWNFRKTNDGFFVIDDMNDKVLKYSNAGDLISTTSVSMNKPYDLCVLDGKVIVSDKGASSLISVDIASGSVTSQSYPSVSPTYLSCDAQAGYIFFYNDAKSSIVKVDASSMGVIGEVVAQDDMKVKMGAPGYIAISPVTGDVVTVDVQNHKLIILDSRLNLKQIIGGAYGDSPTNFKFPAGVDFNNDGELYLIDRMNRKMKIYDANYNYLRSFPISNSGMDVYILDDGRVLYDDDTSNNVFVLDRDGNVLSTWSHAAYDEPFNDNKKNPMTTDSFGSPHGLGYYDGKFYVVDEAFPPEGGKYRVFINSFDENFNWLARSEMIIPNNFGLSETIAFYDGVVIIPSNEENLLWFYDLEKEEVIDKLLLTHEVAFTTMEIEAVEGTRYALVSNQKDGKIFKVDLKDRKIVDEWRVAVFYGDGSEL